MKRLAALYLTREFGHFLLAGGAAAAANFGSRFLFDIWTPYAVAVIAAFGVGVITAFVLNRVFVFPASGRGLHRELAWFALFNAIAFPVTLGCAVLLHTYLFDHFLPPALSKAVSHGIGIVLPVIINFVAHKFVTFRKAA